MKSWRVDNVEDNCFSTSPLPKNTRLCRMLLAIIIALRVDIKIEMFLAVIAFEKEALLDVIALSADKYPQQLAHI
jgi:hypothetical protein